MKLLRKRVIVAGILLAVAGGGVYGLKLYLEREKRLEHLVVQAVSPYIKGSLQVGRARIGFFSAHLTDVTAQLPAQALAITVEEIQVSFSIVRFVLSGFSLARSIGKIVLVGPIIEIAMVPPAVADMRRPADAGFPAQVSRSFAVVEFLYVKNGTIKLRDRRGQVAVLGEQLQGRMWDGGTELNYNLAGKLGAERKNLFVNGRISWRGETHRLSLQLDQAEISRPIVFKNVVITSGELSGILEFAFPDTATFANVESNGWVRINHGTCRIGAKKKLFKSVDLSLSIAGACVTLDSLSFSHSGGHLRASGTWDLAGKAQSDRIDFQCRNLWLDSLGLRGVRDLCRIFGAGWVQGTIERTRGSDATLSLISGGVTLWGTPLLRLSAHVKLQHGQLELDTLSLRSPAVTFNGTGILDYSRKPLAFGFKGNGAFDSVAYIQHQMKGKALFSADLNGIGHERSGQLVIQGSNIRYSGIPLGAVNMTARMQGDSGSFFIHNKQRGCKIEAGGVLRGLFTRRSKVLCTLSLKVNKKSPFYSGKLARFPRPDSLKAMAFFGGWSDTFQVVSAAYIHGRKVNGGISFRCARRFLPAPVPVEWEIEPLNLYVAGFPSACNGSGSLYRDSLVIDSLALLDRAVFSGRILRKKPVSAAITCTFNIPLKNVAGLFVKSGNAVESGSVSGTARFSGPFDKIESRSEVHVRGAKIGGVGTLETDATVNGTGTDFTVLPFVLRKDGSVIATLDTIRNSPRLHLAGKFDDIDLKAFMGPLVTEETAVEGKISGSFSSSDSGLPVAVAVSSPRISINGRRFDSASAIAAIDSSGVRVRSLQASDGLRSFITASGFVPLSFLREEKNEKDTLRAAITVKGDIIASLHHNVSDAINGSGRGSLVLKMEGPSGNWHVREGSFRIPKGTLLIKPYLYNSIKDFSCSMTMKDSSSVNVLLKGMAAGKRPVRIFSTHEIPKGYEPIRIGPFNFGILQIETPKNGIDVHLPGFMEKGETGDLEPAGRNPFRYFSLAGPVTNPTVSGLLLLHDLEFTYPLLNEEASTSAAASRSVPAAAASSASLSGHSVLSLVRWELDLKAADRKVMYFRDISGNNTRLIRFLEAYLDQGSSELHLRGCSNENTLKITGIIKSYHGAVYYGKTFDRNFEAGLEFIPQKRGRGQGYDNRPVLWGTAEAYSDTSRFDRIKLIALVQDPATGQLSERGRLAKGKLNVVFRFSSDFEELPGVSEREFYRQEGLQFTTFGGAGKMMSDFGEQNLHRIFLQRFERKLAKIIGLDVISFETSIASNYFTMFYNRQFENRAMQMQADYLALANAGLTVGRYLWSDMFFVKASGGLLPVDTALTPQYAIGLEFQPTRYLFMNFDYGFYKKDLVFEHNPRVNLQLRLPISGLRNLLDF
jgi:hypothetical protein